ncbi:acetyltransferase [Anaeramoeba ignava]|uniref:Acetyltransferase n=1 Tax=Anaeramoeba ignava TaxID=1746090 RepID=A0A9Q0R534_ANAIG|nr:acetyltransferase [Anaeramoeba ignava]
MIINQNQFYLKKYITQNFPTFLNSKSTKINFHSSTKNDSLKEEILLDDKLTQLKLIKTPIIKEDTISLLKRIRFAANDMKYSFSESIKSLLTKYQIENIELRRKDELLGFITLKKHKIFIEEKPIENYYLTNFCVNPTMRSRGYGKLIINNVLSYLDAQIGEEPSLISCFIKESNIQTVKAFLHLGFNIAAKYRTFWLSDINPQSSHQLVRLNDEKMVNIDEYKGFWEKFSESHSKFILNDFRDWVLKDDFYGLKKNNEIVAAAQFTPIKLQFHPISAQTIWDEILNIVCSLYPQPLLEKELIHPFFNFSIPYFKEGNEDQFVELIKTVLQNSKMRAVSGLFDERNEMFKNLFYYVRKNKKMGEFGKILTEQLPLTFFMVEFKNFKMETLQKIKNKSINYSFRGF